jgi:hypothetical protein
MDTLKKILKWLVVGVGLYACHLLIETFVVTNVLAYYGISLIV